MKLKIVITISKMSKDIEMLFYLNGPKIPFFLFKEKLFFLIYEKNLLNKAISSFHQFIFLFKK